MDERPLLGAGEPAPFVLENAKGASPIVFVCEHGGHLIPARLDFLGLREEHRYKHFMWDIGALALARSLARQFDAPLAHQSYSRMVCDCNRRPDVAAFIPEHGEGIAVPGNLGLSAVLRDQRRAEIWQPFHDRLAALLDARQAAGQATILVTIHSFTPIFYGEARRWQAGVLYEQDRMLSPLLYDILAARFGDVIGRNEPYSMGRDTDYTVPVHGEDRGLPCTEIEVRNDLIADDQGRRDWTMRLAGALQSAVAEIRVQA